MLKEKEAAAPSYSEIKRKNKKKEAAASRK